VTAATLVYFLLTYRLTTVQQRIVDVVNDESLTQTFDIFFQNA